MTDRASMARHQDLPGIETLSARYLRQNFRPHAHDEYILGVIDAGTHAVWCRGEMHLAPAGTVVTMRPGDIHHGGAADDRGWHQRMVYLSEPALAELLADVADGSGPAVLDFAAAFHARPSLARQLSALHRVLHGGEALARDQALDALLRAVLAQLAPADLPALRPGPSGRIADAVEYLAAHAEDNVPLARLADIAGLRRRQTIEAFRRQTGLPPHAWQIQQRIARARRLLAQGMPPAEVAAATGFADQSHLTRHFRAILGVTPGVYARG